MGANDLEARSRTTPAPRRSQGDALKEEVSVESPRSRRTRIRRLGYDPEQLTFEEQRELLEIEASLPVGRDTRAIVAVS